MCFESNTNHALSWQMSYILIYLNLLLDTVLQFSLFLVSYLDVNKNGNIVEHIKWVLSELSVGVHKMLNRTGHMCISHSHRGVVLKQEVWGRRSHTKSKGRLQQIVRIKWALRLQEFHTGSSCFIADFWLAVRICVSLAHTSLRSQPCSNLIV